MMQIYKNFYIITFLVWQHSITVTKTHGILAWSIHYLPFYTVILLSSIHGCTHCNWEKLPSLYPFFECLATHQRTNFITRFPPNQVHFWAFFFPKCICKNIILGFQSRDETIPINIPTCCKFTSKPECIFRCIFILLSFKLHCFL